MGARDWSTTAANNAVKPGINFAEGQDPPSLNNSCRQVMADMAKLVPSFARVVTEDGAVGDGVTNDQAAIQATIDAVAAAGGGTVLIPNGTFLMNYRNSPDAVGVCCLELKTGVVLRGVSKHGTILKLANAQLGPGTYGRLIMAQNNVNNIGIENLTVDGNQAGQTGYELTGNGGNIIFKALNGVCVRGIVSKNSNGQGIQVAPAVGGFANYIDICDNTVFNCKGPGGGAGTGIGIQVSHFNIMKIQNNIVYSTVDNCIDWYGENGTGTADSRLWLVSGNAVVGGRCGLFCETTRSGSIVGNMVGDMTELGFAVNRINGAPVDILVAQNNIENCPVGGRISGDTQGVTVSDNFFGSTGVGGALVLGTAGGNVSYVNIHDNTFRPNDPSYAVILVPAGVVQIAYVKYWDNIIYGATAEALTFVNNAGVTVETEGSMISILGTSMVDLRRKKAVLGELSTGKLRVTAPTVPASAVAAGTAGDFAWDAAYLYICTAANTWRRVAHATW